MRRQWGKAGAATALGGAIAIALVLAACSGGGHKSAAASAALDSATAGEAADCAAISAASDSAAASEVSGDANASAAAADGATAATGENAEGAKGDVMQGAVLGADMGAFDAKFGAGAKQDCELTTSYEDGKLRVMANEGYAYNIYTTYSDRGETPSLDDALAFARAFLPDDAEPVRASEDAAVKTATYVYKSQSLAAKTKLSGRLVVTIFRNPDDADQIRQAMVAVDITGNY